MQLLMYYLQLVNRAISDQIVGKLVHIHCTAGNVWTANVTVLHISVTSLLGA